ncbi:MAG: DUF4270 family protein [Ferruginibacter sp.]|nr:DUF4270 family protein [Ferruginibacter sp.]
MPIKLLRVSIAVMAMFSFFIFGCNKLDTTQLGADLIPAVDNIRTFADTLDISAVQENPLDSTRLFRTEDHVVGAINNDPVFGKTKAELYLQLKPAFFPYYFGSAVDTIVKFDSVFLCLAYKDFYGDSTIPQTLKVYTLNSNTTNFVDSSYRLDFALNAPYSNLVGQTTIAPRDVLKKVYIRSGKDSVTNQVRIPLSQAFLNQIASLDSSVNMANNAFRSDSIFKTFFKGFAVVSENTTANGLFYVNLADPLTRLEIHYVKKKASPLDTTYSSWTFAQGTVTSVGPSAHATVLKRDPAGSEFASAPQPNALYLQSTPGSAITLTIPELNAYPNRIIHRAEVIIEQIPGDPIMDKILPAPAYLYLDLVDDTSVPKKFKPVYYDLNPATFYNPDDQQTFFPNAEIDHNYYGGYLKTISDNFGTRGSYFFNLTRYVQNMVTKRGRNYRLRVTAPYNLSYYGLNLNYTNKLAYGRVKVGNGVHPTSRMRMRVVYSVL